MAYTSPCKEELLASIRPDMKLTWDFFKRIYGYEISWPGFADKAIAALEANGCGRARDYYETWVSKYEAEHDAEMKRVAAWYLEECKRQWERKAVRKSRKEREAEQLKVDLQQKSDRELLTLLQTLKQNGA